MDDNQKSKQPIAINPGGKVESSVEGVSKFKPKTKISETKSAPKKSDASK